MPRTDPGHQEETLTFKLKVRVSPEASGFGAEVV